MARGGKLPPHHPAHPRPAAARHRFARPPALGPTQGQAEPRAGALSENDVILCLVFMRKIWWESGFSRPKKHRETLKTIDETRKGCY